MSEHPLRIFTGSAHPDLALEIANVLDTEVGKTTTTFLPDSEIYVKIDEVVRDQDIFFIQPCSRPVNDHLMELLLYIDAFRRASVNSITAILPYFPYSRQERMAHGREAISARVVATLLETMGVKRVMFIDIHNPAIQGFFTIPVDPISAVPVLADYLKTLDLSNSSIISPDVGRASMAGKYAEMLNLPLVVMHKRRTSFSETHTTHVVGEIEGRRPILIDDLLAGGSVLKQVDALYEHGAVGKTIFTVTHPILLPSAVKLLDQDDRIEKLVCSNSICIPEELRHPKIQVVSIAPLLADIIERMHRGSSIIDRLILV